MNYLQIKWFKWIIQGMAVAKFFSLTADFFNYSTTWWLIYVPTCMRKAWGPPDFTCRRQSFSFLKPWILTFAKRDKTRGMAGWRCLKPAQQIGWTPGGSGYFKLKDKGTGTLVLLEMLHILSDENSLLYDCVVATVDL